MNVRSSAADFAAFGNASGSGSGAKTQRGVAKKGGKGIKRAVEAGECSLSFLQLSDLERGTQARSSTNFEQNRNQFHEYKASEITSPRME